MSAVARGRLISTGSRPLATTHGRFDVHVFRNLATRMPALALTRGDLRSGEPVVTRVHSSCVTSETFAGCDCDCAGQLDAALARIADRGRGALFYLMQEGRGAGFLAKARDRMLVQASGHRLTTFEAYDRMGLGHDGRRYDEVTAMIAMLELRAPLALLSNNPDKVAALEREGVRIASVERLQHDWSPFNQHYVASKRTSGHALEPPPSLPDAAVLPEPVTEIEPHAIPEAPALLRVASYLLPVRRPSDPQAPPLWLRLHAWLDRATASERVSFSFGDDERDDRPVAVVPERLLERFPQPARVDDRSGRSAWRRALDAFARAGCGVAVFLPPTDPSLSDPDLGPDDVDDTTRRLLAHHLGGRPARPLVDDAA